MAKIDETVEDIGLKNCIAKVKELNALTTVCRQLARDAQKGLMDLLDSPLGTVELAKPQLDYQFKVSSIIVTAMDGHGDAEADMMVALSKAYNEWKETESKVEKARQLEGIPALPPPG